MTAAELRIGNWVILQQDDNGIQRYNHDVDAIDIAVAVDNPERFSPIPLSPELLRAAGFKWNESINHWTIQWGKNGVHFIKKDEHYIGYSFQLGAHHYKVIEHLHQLQNLFYSLTGEELSIDLINVPSTNK